MYVKMYVCELLYIYIYIYIYIHVSMLVQMYSLVGRVFTNGQRDQGSIAS